MALGSREKDSRFLAQIPCLFLEILHFLMNPSFSRSWTPWTKIRTEGLFSGPLGMDINLHCGPGQIHLITLFFHDKQVDSSLLTWSNCHHAGKPPTRDHLLLLLGLSKTEQLFLPVVHLYVYGESFHLLHCDIRHIYSCESKGFWPRKRIDK